MEESVYLRALELSDLEKVHEWHNNPNLYNTLKANFTYVSRITVEAWLKDKCTFLRNEVNLAICIKDTYEHIGNIYLRNIDWISQTAELSIFIGEAEHQGKGHGTSALRQIISYAFDEMNLRKLCFSVLADNKAAQSMYKKLGFTVEGTLKRHSYKNGEFKDIVCMGMFRTPSS